MLLHLGDQPLHLPAGAVLLGMCGALGKAAGTLQKTPVIVFPPADDILFPHQVQRPDELHPRKVGAVPVSYTHLDVYKRQRLRQANQRS